MAKSKYLVKVKWGKGFGERLFDTPILSITEKFFIAIESPMNNILCEGIVVQQFVTTDSWLAAATFWNKKDAKNDWTPKDRNLAIRWTSFRGNLAAQKERQLSNSLKTIQVVINSYSTSSKIDLYFSALSKQAARRGWLKKWLIMKI